MPSDDVRDELAALTSSAAALLRWEQELSGLGVPPHAPVETATPVENASVEPSDAASSVGDAGPSGAIRLDVLAAEAAACTACRLHEGRTKSVFARGSEKAELLFVGDGPDDHEDQEGLPFVGRAGTLLDKMIAAMGYGPEEIYICNVVKCRPPDNRAPHDDEAAACARFLDAQVDKVAPRAMVALGRSAAERLHLIEPKGRDWRGRWSSYRDVPVLATYHPAYLLRTPQAKRQVWDDLQDVMRRLGREPPARA